MQTEKIMTEVANEKSYATWGDLMYDSHEHSQIEYTNEVMRIAIMRFLKWRDETHYRYLLDTLYQYSHSNEELFEYWNNNNWDNDSLYQDCQG